eukprot:1654196-Lingulodinium_polyedra.AAC.1
MAIGSVGPLQYCDPERDSEIEQPVPEYASDPACNEVFQDYSSAWHDIERMFEQGKGHIFHSLSPVQLDLVFTNA